MELPATSYCEVTAEQNSSLFGLTSSEKGRDRKGSCERATVALTLGVHDPIPAANALSEPSSMFRAREVDVPPGVVTVTATDPEPGGAPAVIRTSLATEKDEAFADPNLTAVASVKPDPVIARLVRSVRVLLAAPIESTRGGSGNDAVGSPAVR